MCTLLSGAASRHGHSARTVHALNPPTPLCRTPPVHERRNSRSGSLSRRLMIETAIATQFLEGQATEAEKLAAVTPPVAPQAPLRDAELAIIDVFEKSTRGVVNIFDLSLQGRAAPTADAPEGNGSGFVWSRQGHIVSNYHVLGSILRGLGPNAAQRGDVKVARVTLLDKEGVKRDYVGTLVGALRSKDLVVLKVAAPPELLQPLPLGSSAGVKVGQQCLAIGNPFGFDHTLTTGAVSGMNRVIQSQAGSTIAGGIQTDAAINPGNSGGPLLNSKGQVIGINTAIFTSTGTSAGVGFAIPIDTVARIVPQLITNGRVMTPTLGVTFASDAVARSLKLQPGGGALIQALESKSAAGKAGLLPTRRVLTGISAGDVITSVAGKRVRYPQDVDTALDEAEVGATVSVKYLRGIDSSPTEAEVRVVLEAAEG